MSKSKRFGLSVLLVAVMAMAIVFGSMAFSGGNVASAADKTPINLGDWDMMHWVLAQYDSNLRNGPVYEYTYDNELTGEYDLKYYSIVKLDISPRAMTADEEAQDPGSVQPHVLDANETRGWVNWTLTNTYAAGTSVVRYRHKDFDHRIAIKNATEARAGDMYTVEYDNTDGYQVTATAPGRYEARATLTPSANYYFTYNRVSASADYAARGINILLNADGTATVTKVWYVATYDNGLLNAEESIAKGEEVEYTIPDWKFGEFAGIAIPRLHHGDGLLNEAVVQPDGYKVTVDGEVIAEVETGGSITYQDAWNPASANQENDILTFTLSMGDTVIGEENMPRSKWGYYINEFMPVGEYQVTFEAKSLMLGSHKHWWNDAEHYNPEDAEIEYQGFTRTFFFKVTAGDLTVKDSEFNAGANPGLNDLAVNVADIETNGYEAFFGVVGNIECENFIDKVTVEESNTYWSTVADEYFEEAPQVSFNLARMLNAVYMTADNESWSQYISTPSAYTVFYRATMKNYSAYPSMDDSRYDSFFRVRLYQELDVPVLNRNEFYYTGGMLSVACTGDMSLFDMTNASNTDANEYNVMFVIKNDKQPYYKWKGKDFGEAGTAKYTIKPAPVVAPKLYPQTYTGDEIEANINIPVGLFSNPLFTVNHPNGVNKYVNAGNYSITCALIDKNNYFWEGDDADKDGVIQINFTINRADNVWTAPVHIVPWTWGNYDSLTNMITGASKEGNVLFTVYTDAEGNNAVSGLKGFSLDNGFVKQAQADKLAELKAGTYYIGAKVNRTQNFEGLTVDPMAFEILLAQNYWETTPNIIRWTWGSFDADVNLILGSPRYGKDLLKYSIEQEKDGVKVPVKGLEDVKVTNCKVAYDLISVFNGLDQGKYFLHATVAVTDNEGFTGRDDYVEFNVLAATNGWIERPYIARWIYNVEEPSLPTAKSLYGQPKFQILDDDDNVYYLYEWDGSPNNVNRLDEATPGWYRFVAYVDGSLNYPALRDSDVRFRVFSSNANTWTTTPNIQGWIAGQTPSAPVGAAAFGTVTYAYETKDGEKLEGAPTTAGEYVLVATATSDEALDLVARISFTVQEAAPVVKDMSGAVLGLAIVLGILGVALIATVIVFVIKLKKA